MRGVPGAVVVLELVEPLQVEGERAALAVEFDAQGVLAPGGVPGGLEGRQRAGGEPAGEQGGVVDGDRPGAGRGDGGQAAARRGGQRPLTHERLGERGDAREVLTGQVLGEVDDVRAEVAERTGAGLFPAQPPGERELRVHQPVLEVRHPHVPQGADAALHHHPPGQRGGGAPAVVEADHGGLAAGPRLLGGAGHRLGLADGVGEGLLAQHVLARASAASAISAWLSPGCRCRRGRCRRAPPGRASRSRSPPSRAGRPPPARHRRPGRRSRPSRGGAAARRHVPRCASPGSGRRP